MITAALSLQESDTELVYTGVGEAEGLSLTIRKDDSNLDVHQVAPVSMTRVAWTDLHAVLADRVV